MAIVCGTDFSTSAMEACRIAAKIAARLGELLRIVHVVEDLGADIALARGSDDGGLYRPERDQMGEVEAQARALGARVEAEVVGGVAAHILSARALDASLVVVGYLGRDAPGRWLVGSNAERLARMSPAPLFIVRSPEPVAAWLDGRRPRLGLVLGADRSEASRATARSLGLLTRLGALDVAVIHIVAPGERDVGLERALQRDLAPELASAGVSAEHMRFEVRSCTTQPESELVATAEALAAPLLAVGAHQRATIDRLWRRSISRRVVHLAPMNVFVVPSVASHRVERPSPVISEVLVATDLSELGNRAVPHALALLQDGGVLHLAHVWRPAPSATPRPDLFPGGPLDSWVPAKDVAARLERLVPVEAARKGISVQAHVLEGKVPDALCAAAERLAVDVVCLASRARRPVHATVVGSATLGVLARSRRPVFVVREPED